MEMRQIYYVLEVAKEKNFSKAATNLFITQSNISQQISSLEIELNTKLFFRDHHGVKLTEDGKNFCFYAKDVTDAIDKLMMNFNSNTMVNKELLNIAVFPFANKVGITSVVTEFFKRNANILMSIKVTDNYAAYDGLNNGELDFAIVKLRPEDKLNTFTYKFLAEEKLYLVINKDNIKATQSSIFPSDLSEIPLLMADANSSIYNDVKKIYREIGANFNVVFENTTDINLLNDMISEGRGATIATEYAAASIDDSRIKAILIESPVKFCTYLAYPKNREYTGIYGKFIEHVILSVKKLYE